MQWTHLRIEVYITKYLCNLQVMVVCTFMIWLSARRSSALLCACRPTAPAAPLLMHWLSTVQRHAYLHQPLPMRSR